MEHEPKPLVTSDSFAALANLFMSPANPKWGLPPPKGYSESTKKTWGHALRFLARPNCLGRVSRFKLKPSLVQACMDGIADKPGKQEACMAALRAVEKWAIVRDLLPLGGVTRGVEISTSDAGHLPWTEAQLELAERHADPRLSQAVTLAANTGQRGSDLVRMGWTDLEVYEGIQGINVVQKKTKRRVWIPITAELAAAMATWERRPGPFLMKRPGEPWTRDRLTQAWAYERDHNPNLEELRVERLDLEDGVDIGKDRGLVLHGLRGFSCVRLRRTGASESQIADMVGMSIEMVANYCRFAAQRDNAVAAVLHLKNAAPKRIRG